MDRCFVIQPFDNGPFDKRYEDVFAPAIKAAGLEPYRVDRDPGVTIPIEDIEAGIRSAKACLADITTDNPNVWFELGLAIAAQKDVCLVCSSERQRFPFDIQHRSILKYRVESPRDFDKLQKDIVARIKAMQEKRQQLQAVADIAPTTTTEGLAPHEVAVLLTLMREGIVSGAVSGWSIRQDMTQAGFTEVAASIAIALLARKKLIATEERPSGSYDNESTIYCFLTPQGVEWVLANQNTIQLHYHATDPPVARPIPPASESTADDSIPF